MGEAAAASQAASCARLSVAVAKWLMVFQDRKEIHKVNPASSKLVPCLKIAFPKKKKNVDFGGVFVDKGQDDVTT